MSWCTLLLVQRVRGDRLGLSCSRVLRCACVLFVLLFCGHDGLKSLGSCVEVLCFSEAGSPFSVPCRFSCSLLFRRHAVDRSVNDSRGSSPFRLLSPQQKFFNSISFLSSHSLADRFLQQDQG